MLDSVGGFGLYLCDGLAWMFDVRWLTSSSCLCLSEQFCSLSGAVLDTLHCLDKSKEYIDFVFI